MARKLLLLSLALALVVTGGAFAQGVQTGSLFGTVTGPEGTPLPGVAVTASSSVQMSDRTAYTGENGDYIIRGLTPGDYTVRFTLDGMQTVEAQVAVPLGQPARIDRQLQVSATVEAITITADAPTALETTTVGANIKAETVRQLPVTRTPVGIASLAPAVTTRTPVGGQLNINGALAYDNAFLVNGINVQDPIFGTTNNLFIEDSILETQVLTSGIMAEYGHFTGGVLNVVTKSGSNDFSGSLRADLSKPEWRDETPYEKGFRGTGVPRAKPTERKGDMTEIYSLTLGGPVMRDRLWFFVAGRNEESTTPNVLPVTGTQVNVMQENPRYEIKLTGNLTPNHTLQGSYTDNPVERDFEFQVSPIELDAVARNSSRPNEGFSVNYTGVLRNNVFAEARYSEKKFRFVNVGSPFTDIMRSPMRSSTRFSGNVAGTFNAPYFDATDPEDRDNEQIFGAVSWFLSTGRIGSHDIKGGVESFTVTRTGGNSQTATDYVIYTGYKTAGGQPVFGADGKLIPVFNSAKDFPAGQQTRIGWWVATRGAILDITTDSFFLQDRWDLNANFSFGLGVRHEQVNSEATGGITGIDTSNTVPRASISYDPMANGKYKVDVTYAEYAGRYNPAIVGSNTPVGVPKLLYGYYNGPSGEGRNFTAGFDPANYVFYYARVPTANVFFEDGLKSPVNEELTFSAGMALPRGGWLKATYVDRDLTGVIDNFTTLDNGCTNIVFEGVNAGCIDNVEYRNTSVPRREYESIQLQARYNLMRNWLIEGNYTHQMKNHGDYEGEGGQSIGTSAYGDRPEIQSPRERPYGRLPQFQEHKVRFWTTYNLNLGRAGNLSTGVIYSYDSEATFSYSTSVPRSAASRALNPGYKQVPGSVGLFFGERGAGEFEDFHTVDLALNYGIPVFKSIEPWIKVDIKNLMNDDTQISWNTGIVVDPNSSLDALGYRTGYLPGTAFGRPTSAGSYLTPREYLVSAGIRF